MSDTLRVRNPVPQPTNLAYGTIAIYHPGYPDGDAPLLALRGYDTEQGHLWRDVAHTACAIICNNRFDGWLSKFKSSDAERFDDELLPSGKYWWHMPHGESFVVNYVNLSADLTDSSDPYAIITDLRSWRFPETMPQTWITVEPEISEEHGDKCQVTSERHATHEAHIVPVSETDWYNDNQRMTSLSTRFSSLRGTGGDATIDNASNLLRLRTDIHHAWDQKELTFVPKRTITGDIGVVVHCLDSGDVAFLYHNLPLRDHIRTELLLARFAWTLFPLAVYKFLSTNRARMLWIVDAQGNMAVAKKSATECHIIANGPTPRSTSNKKRKATESVTKMPDEQREEIRRGSSQSIDSGFDSSSDSVESFRGRKRFRRQPWSLSLSK